MKALKDIIQGGTEGILNAGTELVDRFITSGDEKIKAKTEFRKIIQDFEIQMNDSANRQFEIEVQDRSNARALQIAALQQSGWLAKNFIYLLSLITIIGAAAFVIALFIVHVPDENRRLVEMAADLFVFAAALTIYQYFFGSSSGSKQKTDHLAISEQMKSIDGLTMTRFEKQERRKNRRDKIDESDL